MNKNNKTSSNIITITVIAVAAVALGYFLFKSSPENKSVTPITKESDNIEAGSSTKGKGEVLDSLVGKPLPDMTLIDKDGKTYTPNDLKGKNIVFFFNEGLMCYPACWNQMSAFGSDKRFNNDQVQAISVVVDSPSDWQKAIAQMPQLAKAMTLFDTNKKASTALGVLTLPSSMHKGMLPGHTYIIVDKNGIVRYVFDDPNMSTQNDMLFGKIGELK